MILKVLNIGLKILCDMRILSVGSLLGLSNTCLHRNWALHKVADEVDEVNTQTRPTSLITRICYHLFFWGLPIRIPENDKENEKIKEMVRQKQYDVVWIDKGHTILASTLKYIKTVCPSTIIVSYSPDNMALRHNQSQQYLECIPYYDYIFTNKSYILDDMKKLGAKNIHFVNNSYEESFHHPMILTDRERNELGGDVGFVGMWEKERCESILYLATHGVHVKVFGDKKWNRYTNYSPNLEIVGYLLKGEDYSKALQAFRISLCFLRKMNLDQQTTRSVEIPACGGFMLAERTKEHMTMFEENKEAVYFSSNEELLEKCVYFLCHEDERRCIAAAGRKRCLTSGYNNEGMIRNALKTIFDTTN